jgi:nicotinamide riboside kinase
MLKIAITGPESTGKSDLSHALASHFQGKVLHEYAREYLETRGPSYLQETVEQIAREQMRQQNELLLQNDRHVFFDTDLLVCRIWLEFVFGKCPQHIVLESLKPVFSHTLLMNIDLPWQADPF